MLLPTLTPRLCAGMAPFITHLPRRHFAGHSKWAKIARAKGANDAQRSIIISKVVKAITAAAKVSPDTTNLRLAAALDLAKKSNIPRDVVERALRAKADGGAALEPVTYEATGPCGVAFVVEALTGNRNRTAASLRSLFTKSGGDLGGPGSTAWVFKSEGEVVVRAGDAATASASFEEALLEKALEAGAFDVRFEEEEEGGQGVGCRGPEATLVCERDAVESVRAALSAWPACVVERAGVVRVPSSTTEVSGEEAEEAFGRLLDGLDAHEDVQDYVHNAGV
jgi:YebC/PmpR family DNA-binding regulatory protein